MDPSLSVVELAPGTGPALTPPTPAGHAGPGAAWYLLIQRAEVAGDVLAGLLRMRHLTGSQGDLLVAVEADLVRLGLALLWHRWSFPGGSLILVLRDLVVGSHHGHRPLLLLLAVLDQTVRTDEPLGGPVITEPAVSPAEGIFLLEDAEDVSLPHPELQLTGGPEAGPGDEVHLGPRVLASHQPPVGLSLRLKHEGLIFNELSDKYPQEVGSEEVGI